MKKVIFSSVVLFFAAFAFAQNLEPVLYTNEPNIEMHSISLTRECKEKGIVDLQECEKFTMFLNRPVLYTDGPTVEHTYHMPSECAEKGITDPEECEKMFRLMSMPYECRQFGIANQVDCENYLRELYLPRECKENEIKDDVECERYLRMLYMPQDCKDQGITDQQKCEEYLTSLHMPPECKEIGATTREECDAFMFKQLAPPVCIEAGLTNEIECEEFLFSENQPEDCIEARIKDPEACKKYMFEKYGGAENIPPEKYPPECIEEGAKNIDECEAIMNIKYTPKVCLDQGLTTEDDCSFYIQQKYTPQECKDAGALDRQSCDKVMFSKYAPQECKDAGIDNEHDCEEYMVNKYKPRVTCESGDDENCDFSFRERHLGHVVATQQKYERVKKEVQNLERNTVQVRDFEEKLGEGGATIPIRQKETKVKIVGAEERIILKKDDSLVQTAPVLLMIDNDEDGLTDDLEHRFGTDPFNPDTDGDGKTDRDEVKNRQNPLGEGAFGVRLAPIEEAIAGDFPLEHPKASGEISKDFVIEAVFTESGQMLKGKADPDTVGTLYIYSEMPFVVTVKTDPYGNWQYELGNSLNDGEHEVYVAINDNTGKVVEKSSPLNFFVKEARALSVNDFVAASMLKPETKADAAMNSYILLAVVFVGLAILGFVVIMILKFKKAETPTI